jgi:hypothetical protein
MAAVASFHRAAAAAAGRRHPNQQKRKKTCGAPVGSAPSLLPSFLPSPTIARCGATLLCVTRRRKGGGDDDASRGRRGPPHRSVPSLSPRSVVASVHGPSRPVLREVDATEAEREAAMERERPTSGDPVRCSCPRRLICFRRKGSSQEGQVRWQLKDLGTRSRPAARLRATGPSAGLRQHALSPHREKIVSYTRSRLREEEMRWWWVDKRAECWQYVPCPRRR